MKHEKICLKFSIALTVLLLLMPVLAFAGLEVTKTTLLGLNSLEKMKPNGEYVVEVFKDNKWQEAGSLSFDKHFREREIDLNKFTSANELLKIRLTEKGGGGAHIDSVLLGGLPPQELKGSEDKLAIKKLSKKDFDVIDAYKKTIELSFLSKEDMRLTLTARVEAEVISKLPFQFPLKNSIAKIDENSAFYPYFINSNTGNIKVDGNIADEGFSEPFFKEFSRTGSGHPSDYTYGWVRNDEKNLYVALDFVPDNTMDGDKDYAKVYVKTPAGVHEFKASVPELIWGKPGFTYTEHAGYQHKVYEFSIPLGELGIANITDGEKMELAFAAYGTAAIAVDFGDAPDSYGTLLASNGARHSINGILYLGVSVDDEIDGQPDATATGDDNNGNDDEDGVVFNSSLTQGMSSATVDVTSSNPAFLNAWVDFNQNGIWDLPEEQIFVDQPLAAGVNNLVFSVPALAVIGDTFARFRVDSSGGLLPTGPAADGEVEDYMITIFSSECIPPPSGMISWWGGDNNALDMIGTNNGTLMNGVTYDIGQVGQAFLFDGTDDFVDLGTDDVFNFNGGTGDFTIDMWIYPDILPAFAYGLASKATHGPGGQFTGPYSGWSFYLYDDGSLGFGGAGVWEFVSPADTVTAGIGQHIAITKSGSIYKLYHNGTEVASVDHGNLETSASELLLGASYADDNFFNGSIDEVEIFNRALTVDEIALIYHAGSAGKCRPCATPPSGMVSWWKGEDNAGDSVDGNNGTLIGNTTYETGKVGQAISFDGAGDYVEIPDSASLDLTRISMSIWFKLNELNRVHELANKIGPEGSDTISYGSEIGPDNKAYFRISTGGTLGSLVDAASTTVLTSGIWYHFAGTYDGSSVKIFINGIEEDSKSQSGDIFNSPENLKLGTYGYYPWYLNGLIDEVAVFNRALSADEIAAIYNAGSAGKCNLCVEPPSNMVSWWKGEDNADDSTGNNNGTFAANTYADGKVGQSFSFDGVDDSVDLGTWFDLQTFTIDMWVRPGSSQVQYADIIDNNHTAFRSWTLQQDSLTTNRYEWGTSASGPGIPFTLNADEWAHIALVRNGVSRVKSAYVNGVLVGSVNDTSDITYDGTEYLRLGRWGGGGRNWNGLIDEVEIFDRALTADEIASIYNAGSAGKCYIDTIPDAFTFTDQTEVNLSAVIESNALTVSGINSPTFIGITDCTGTNCEYSVNGGGWTSTDGTVNNGDTVQVRQTSSGSYSTTTDLTLNIGPVFDVFSVTTLDQTEPLPDLTGNWDGPLTEKCKVKKEGLVCKVKGKLIIRNIGDVDAEYVVFRFYLSDDDSYDSGDILLKADYKSKIVVGKDYRKSFKLTLPVGMSLEGRYIIVYIDAESATVESDESNNFVVYGEASS